jgi:uncharacterized membrane protein YeaQ/YmgE (transglycosylase-associated protein family)
VVKLWTERDRGQPTAFASRRTSITFEEEVVEIIGVILAGIVIGLLGKFIAPGNRDNIPIWLTIICGIGGVLIGWFIYTAFGGNGSPGIDWVRWIIAIAVAAVLVMIASAVTARSRSRVLRLSGPFETLDMGPVHRCCRPPHPAIWPTRQL